MESTIDLLNKFSLVSNILPYYSYPEKWCSLLLSLCKTTNELYKNYKHNFKVLEDTTKWSDDRKVISKLWNE